MNDIKDLATVLSGLSTVVIAVLTLFLYIENRLLRKAGSQPKLVAYFEPHPDGTGGLNIAIANVGTGPAKDIYLQFLGDQEEFAKYDLVLDCTSKRGPITLLPQGEKLSLFFAIGYQLFKQKGTGVQTPISPFKVKLQWTSLQGGKVIEDSYLLDVKPYADLPGFINKPYLLKIVDSIDGVGKGINNLKQDVGSLRHTIEANTIQSENVIKVLGNTENITQ
ncbi:hypothetical protein ACFFUS_17200 [Vibrio gallaecicus]|uniref:hypothetical protein n=1 Tax=Vibrio gallaecicus TaxID=552386 RepID=UPI0010C9E9ED|nr:hypothetical protein [Vibrio gallaecicus]